LDTDTVEVVPGLTRERSIITKVISRVVPKRSLRIQITGLGSEFDSSPSSIPALLFERDLEFEFEKSEKRPKITGLKRKYRLDISLF
jgi:hypothetical protein